MSKCHREHITCQHCGAQGEFEVWDSINVDLNPELKESLFNEDIFIWTCPECGTKTFIPFGTLYHDMTNKFMIAYSYSEENPSFESVEMPNIFEQFAVKDYKFRIVYGLIPFKEKIKILESGLDDVAVERMKYTLTHYFAPDLKAQYGEMYFGSFRTDIKEKSEYGQITFVFVRDGEATQFLTLPADNYYEQVQAIELDKRFEAKDWVRVDETWISNVFKKKE